MTSAMLPPSASNSSNNDSELNLRLSRSTARRWWARRIVVVSLITAIVAGVGVMAWSRTSSLSLKPSKVGAMPRSFTIYNGPESKSISFNRNTIYNSANDAFNQTVNAAWDAVRPDHGIVALKHEWAARNSLPRAINLPSDPSKGVYYLDAYHQIHCLVLIRRNFYELLQGTPLSSPDDHWSHCFDALRQYVMCTSADNLFYSSGQVHHAQVRKCRDWSVLREWAARHSACDPEDTENLNGILRQDLCTHGNDGLAMD